MERIEVSFNYDGLKYSGWIKPLGNCYPPKLFQIVLNDAYMGNLVYNSGWSLYLRPELSSILGDCVLSWWH
jgi:hypothetical protein